MVGLPEEVAFKSGDLHGKMDPARWRSEGIITRQRSARAQTANTSLCVTAAITEPGLMTWQVKPFLGQLPLQ